MWRNIFFLLAQLLVRFFVPVSFLNINNWRNSEFYKKKIISAPRALREFVDPLKFVKKCQLSNESTVNYLPPIDERQLLLFIIKKWLFYFSDFKQLNLKKSLSYSLVVKVEMLNFQNPFTASSYDIPRLGENHAKMIKI